MKLSKTQKNELETIKSFQRDAEEHYKSKNITPTNGDIMSYIINCIEKTLGHKMNLNNYNKLFFYLKL